MSRYFLEVAYSGTKYSGFQVQQNGNTIQAEVTKALQIFYKTDFKLTGSSRTDAGVHALQNFFHFDTEINISFKDLYNLNSLLPQDIVVKNILPVNPDAHCRFNATSRTYHYYVTRFKNPFLFERSYYYPYKLNIDLLHNLAQAITEYNDFTSFSKQHTQVKHFLCHIKNSTWIIKDDVWKYEINGNRFLRGMVKALVGTMLRLAKNNEGVSDLKNIFDAKDCTKADFSAPSKGLFLSKINFPSNILNDL